MKVGLKLRDFLTVEKKRYGVEHISSAFFRTLLNGGSPMYPEVENRTRFIKS